MKRWFINTAIATIALVVALMAMAAGEEETTMGRLTLTSPAFGHEGRIPKKHTCDGSNTNPPLVIGHLPQGTKSLALIVDDPDAPAGTWVHWVVWGLDPGIGVIEENSVPVGAAQGVTDFGRPGYGGPCPPSGTHRYFFKLYALDTALNLPPGSRKAAVESAMQGHIIEQTELIGLYQRR